MKILARLPLLFLGMVALAIGVLAGLARMAVSVPDSAAAQAGNHGALMISAFLGTVISLERAVALGRVWPYLAPLGAALGGLALLIGIPLSVTQTLFIVAGIILTAASALIVRQQPAIYTATLALGALSWLLGSITWAGTTAIIFAVPWWMAFLVLTIAGERLELSRFLPTPLIAQRVFALIVALMFIGLVVASRRADLGLPILAAGLIFLSLWLLRYDIARHTVKQSGLTRYIAICLLAGYAWLAVGGLLGLAGGFPVGSPLRDAALHAVFLGFVFSMIFGHAPIIFPAVARIKIHYHPVFYLPLILLHGSLLVRVIADFGGMSALRRSAAIANGVALLVFVIVILASALSGRRASTRQSESPSCAGAATKNPLKGVPR